MGISLLSPYRITLIGLAAVVGVPLAHSCPPPYRYGELCSTSPEGGWCRVVQTIRHLKPIDGIIGALDDFAWNAAELREASPLDHDLLQRLNASADELIRQIERLTVPDKSQAKAIKAIKEFKNQRDLIRRKFLEDGADFFFLK